MISRLASLKFVAVLGCFLALAACSKKNTPDLNAGTGPGAAAVPGSEQDFTVNVGDRVFFMEDQSSLTPEAQETLRRQSAWLNKYPRVTVQVEGHADEQGTREYNLALGARRANAVREYLVSRGVPTSRLQTVSYGKERPLAICSDETCYSQNRRAVTVISLGSL